MIENENRKKGRPSRNNSVVEDVPSNESNEQYSEDLSVKATDINNNVIEDDPFADLYPININNNASVGVDEIDAALSHIDSINNEIKDTKIPNYNTGYAPAPIDSEIEDNPDMLPSNNNSIFLYEDPMFETEFNLKEWASIDEDGYNYHNVYCLMREYRGDRYSRDDLKRAAFNRAEMLRTVMDVIRHNLNNIEPFSGKNYVEILDETDRTRLNLYRNGAMEKRIGQARLIIRARYGFPVNPALDNLKITVFEHTDPFEIYQHTMEMIEPFYIIISKKPVTGSENSNAFSGDQQSTSRPSAPRQNTGQNTGSNNSRPANGNNTPSQNAGNNARLDEYKSRDVDLDCVGDEDVQNAPYGTKFRYYATKVAHPKNDLWTFYMPKYDAWDAKDWGNVNGSRGIYIYDNGSPLVQEALRDDTLPNLNTGNQAAWHLIIEAVKEQTKNNTAKYVITSMELP